MSASTHPVVDLQTPPSSPKEEDEKKKLTIRTSVVSKTVRKLELDYEPDQPCDALRDEVATRLGVPDQLRPLLVLKQSDAPTVLSGGDTDSLVRALNVSVSKNGDGEYTHTQPWSSTPGDTIALHTTYCSRSRPCRAVCFALG